MAKLSLKNLNKIYPNGVQAVFNFNLEIEDGEFIVLVGPSGCGKSTTLRMIAGLEGITSGEFKIDGNRMNEKAPVDRDIAMVFQNYALYPHMSVYDNVGISLKLRHEQKLYIHDRVQSVSTSLGLDEYLNRLPANLSGGQRQRVALGRTVVRDPKVFLMDEPLSNLDAKLRGKTRTEIVQLQKRLKTTTLYVTHDQIEAMTMADRIVVMKDGYVQQIGTPTEIYQRPNNIFVGSFIGNPPMNFINGILYKDEFTFGNYSIKIPNSVLTYMKDYDGKEIVMGIRPECIDIASNNSEAFKLKIFHAEFLGKEYYLRLHLNEDIITAKVNSRNNIESDEIYVVFDLNKIHFFDKDTTNRICDLGEGK